MRIWERSKKTNAEPRRERERERREEKKDIVSDESSCLGLSSIKFGGSGVWTAVDSAS